MPARKRAKKRTAEQIRIDEKLKALKESEEATKIEAGEVESPTAPVAPVFVPPPSEAKPEASEPKPEDQPTQEGEEKTPFQQEVEKITAESEAEPMPDIEPNALEAQLDAAYAKIGELSEHATNLVKVVRWVGNHKLTARFSHADKQMMATWAQAARKSLGK